MNLETLGELGNHLWTCGYQEAIGKFENLYWTVESVVNYVTLGKPENTEQVVNNAGCSIEQKIAFMN